MDTYASGLYIFLAPVIAVPGACAEVKANEVNWDLAHHQGIAEVQCEVEIPTAAAQARDLTSSEKAVMQQALLASVEIVDDGELVQI
jgi:hypothetical protein